jgi:hypothetical protein
MTTPESIQLLLQRLTQELEETEQAATRGLILLQPVLSLFSNNAIILKYYAYLNNSLLLVEISRRRIQTILETLSLEEITEQETQEAGEELGAMLGRVVETKIGVNQIIRILEE